MFRGRRFFLTLPALLFLGAGILHAQITPGDDEPARVRWMFQETPSFRLLYPEGCQDLADRYGQLLEKYHATVGASLGMVPGALQYGKTPVLLHPHTYFSNGAVTWAPRRMDLYTLPEPSGSDAQPWEVQLAIHEQRHLAQMQFGYRGWLFRTLKLFFGEIIPGGLAGIYPGPALLEGDAVVAETALSGSGRGRNGEFLSYYQVAFDQSDWRDWYRWRYGSYRDYAPDHYALGYMTVAGARVFFGDTLFMQRYFDGVVKNPFRIGRFRRMIKQDGGTSFKASFRKIQEGFQADWETERAARAPFMPMERISAPSRFATNYVETAFLHGRHYAVKAGKITPTTLVRFGEDGSEEDVRPMSSSIANLTSDPVRGRLYWHEAVPDLRWSLAGTNRIRFYAEADGEVRDLTRSGRLFNPVPSPDGETVAAVSYPVAGGSELMILSAEDGAVLHTLPAPSGVQLTELCWQHGRLYALILCDEGFAIWRYAEESWERLTEPVAARMHSLGDIDDALEFVSDLSGVDELYRYDPDTRTLTQITATPYGATDFTSDGDKLFYSAITPSGMALFSTPETELRPRPVTFTPHRFAIAEALREQEKALLTEPAPPKDTLGFREPVRYRRFAHLIRPHSWAPFAFDYDAIRSTSGDQIRDEVDPGVTLLFQNLLGNAYGYVNYARHKDDLGYGNWMNSFHAQLTYTGFWPVLQASLAIGDRNEIKYVRQDIDFFGTPILRNTGKILDRQAVEATLKTYIPLNFTKGGWSRGLIPQLSYTVSNDLFSRERVHILYDNDMESGFALGRFVGSVPGGSDVPLQNVSVAVRGYILRPAASSQVYPSLGIGAETGFQFRPGLTDFFTPSLYGYVYGYLSGFVPQQGLRLSVMVQHLFGGEACMADPHVKLQPRGFTSAAGSWLGQYSSTAAKLTADYAIPFSIGDISFLSPLVYVRNFEFSPHADLTWCGGRDNLFTVGFDLTARLSNFLWFPFDGSFGFSLDYNGGSLYDALTGAVEQNPISAGVIFGLDF